MFQLLDHFCKLYIPDQRRDRAFPLLSPTKEWPFYSGKILPLSPPPAPAAAMQDLHELHGIFFSVSFLSDDIFRISFCMAAFGSWDLCKFLFSPSAAACDFCDTLADFFLLSSKCQHFFFPFLLFKIQHAQVFSVSPQLLPDYAMELHHLCQFLLFRFHPLALFCGLPGAAFEPLRSQGLPAGNSGI